MIDILIIGSTGKLGGMLLKFCFINNIYISAITCFRNKKKLINLKSKYKIKNYFCLSEEKDKFDFYQFVNISSFKIIYFLDHGVESLSIISNLLKKQRNTLFAIANKEMIVAGGKFMINQIKKNKNYFIPLDSEHFSLINLNLKDRDINKVFITASGGPFFFNKKINLNKVKQKKVLSHPKWDMGKNNLIDSSNFINKILEIFELSFIYDINIEKIDFLISREAFVHSIIEYKNHITVFNAFKNNMLITLIEPLRHYYSLNSKFNKDYVSNKSLFNFQNKSDQRFKILKHINQLKKLPHSEQIHFMILNNIAQHLYLNGKITYGSIVNFIITRLDFNSKIKEFSSFSDILNYINMIKKKYNEYYF